MHSNNTTSGKLNSSLFELFESTIARKTKSDVFVFASSCSWLREENAGYYQLF